MATGSWVLIENQLERTDHPHLGQLLTYASGLEAATIVWIAGNFTEEHRSTLDWLNKITDERFRFFGLEVELWSIGDSPAAPKFNIVSKPNDWSRSVSQAARAMEDSDLSDTRLKQLAYWHGLNKALDDVQGPVAPTRTPQPQAWMAYSIGKTGFNLGAVMIRSKRQIRAELYIAGDQAKALFYLLHEQKKAIEEDLGYQLAWEELPTRRDARVATYMENVEPEDERDWKRQHTWLAEKVNEFHYAFSQRIRALNPGDWYGEKEVYANGSVQ
jgi:hypothetical protein